MKKNIYIILCLWAAVLSLGWVSCFKDPSLTSTVPTKKLSVSILRGLYEGQPLELSRQNIGITPLAGTVISDAAAGNIEPGKFVVQQSITDEREGITITAGITVSLQNNSPVGLLPGDSVVFDIQGTILTGEDGSLEIRGVDPAKIFKVGTGRRVAPVQLTLEELSGNFDTYESMLVQITAADVLTMSEDSSFAGSKKLGDGSGGKDVQLYTFSEASFAADTIPSNANFTGIAARAGQEKQLRLRTAGDVSITSIAHHTAIIITGFMSDPAGTDLSVTGAYLGGFEYVQLMATEDIDFDQHPYSVVFSRNAPTSTAPGEGWATGGTRTFKFNLSSGSAKKGSFFYVGGPEKRIAGSVSDKEKSTDISETAPISANRANWIRTLPMYDGKQSATPLLGDDFGGSSTDWLYNRSGYLAGIAVFDGTAVDKTTRPIDALFYGDQAYASFRLFDAVNQLGYLVPDNDFFATQGKEGPQPYYKQGSNTFLLGRQSAAEVSAWASLGGVYSLNAHAWIAQRSITYTALLPPDTPVDQPQLSDIETGVSVTKLRE